MSELVSETGTVGVFIQSRYGDKHGRGVADIVVAIRQIRTLDPLKSLSGPKLEKALQDKATRELIQKVIRDLISSVGPVGVVSIKSEA